MYYIPKGHRAASHVRSGKLPRQHKIRPAWKKDNPKLVDDKKDSLETAVQ